MSVASVYLGRLHRLDLDRLYYNVNLLQDRIFRSTTFMFSCLTVHDFALAEPFVKRSFVEIVRATAGY